MVPTPAVITGVARLALIAVVGFLAACAPEPAIGQCEPGVEGLSSTLATVPCP
jgi:hypothetical protein